MSAINRVELGKTLVAFLRVHGKDPEKMPDKPGGRHADVPKRNETRK